MQASRRELVTPHGPRTCFGGSDLFGSRFVPLGRPGFIFRLNLQNKRSRLHSQVAESSEQAENLQDNSGKVEHQSIHRGHPLPLSRIGNGCKEGVSSSPPGGFVLLSITTPSHVFMAHIQRRSSSILLKSHAFTVRIPRFLPLFLARIARALPFVPAWILSKPSRRCSASNISRETFALAVRLTRKLRPRGVSPRRRVSQSAVPRASGEATDGEKALNSEIA